MNKKDADKETKKKSNLCVVISSMILLLTLVLIPVIGAVTYAVLHNSSPEKEKSDFSATVSENIITSSTTSTTTSSSTSTTSTSTTSTSTTLCGGAFQDPCNGTCNKGFVINADGLCQIVDCVPSVFSGKEGCGVFALNFCRDYL